MLVPDYCNSRKKTAVETVKTTRGGLRERVRVRVSARCVNFRDKNTGFCIENDEKNK